MNHDSSEHVVAVLGLQIDDVLGHEVIEVESFGETKSRVDLHLLEGIQVEDDSLEIDDHDVWQLAECGRFLYLLHFFCTNLAEILTDFFWLRKLL